MGEPATTPNTSAAAPQRGWARTVASRLLLLGFGVVLALIVLEGLLRLGAAVLAARTTKPAAWAGQAHRRILCLGDSNTYGLYVDKSESYPKVLEAMWNPPNGPRNVEVLDMGFPVTNSSKLMKDIDRMLIAFHPDIVVVMIGANDFWTMPESAASAPDLQDRLAAFLWRTSRAYRLFFMMAHAWQAKVEVSKQSAYRATVSYGGYHFDLHGAPRPPDTPDWPADRDLENNLESLPAHVRQIGAQLLLATYASDELLYGQANKIIRVAARKTGTRLVDVAPEFKRLCPQTPCAYFFPDLHPTAIGYRRIAQLLLPQLMIMTASAQPG